MENVETPGKNRRPDTLGVHEIKLGSGSFGGRGVFGGDPKLHRFLTFQKVSFD